MNIVHGFPSADREQRTRIAMSEPPFQDPVYVTRPVLPPLKEYTSRLEAVWERQWLTNHGCEQVELQRRLREYLRARYLTLFNNGTSALFLGIRALGLSGEVITTPFTFPATAHAISWNGLVPVFCDLDPKTMCLDPNRIESLITERTSAVLGVHVYGIPCDTAAIQDIADRHELKVMYDAAHAFGVEINGQPIGNFGDMSMMSFHATKLFNTAEGGCLIYHEPKFEEQLRLLQNFGIKNENEVAISGLNAKMNELEAALGLCVLECVREERNRRSKIVEAYRATLENVRGITCQPTRKDVRESFQYFVIRVDDSSFGASRDKVFERLRRGNVFARKYFYPLCSDYPCYRHLSSAAPENLPVAGKIANQVLSLPLYGSLPPAHAEKIARMIVECGAL